MVAPDSRLLKPRNINRLVLLLAFLAPLVYLFGTQFFALAGAHGEEVLNKQSYVTPDYDKLMEPENFHYGAFDWTNEHGIRFGFSLGRLVVYDSNVYFGAYCRPNGVLVYSEGDGYFDDGGLGFTLSDGAGFTDDYALLTFDGTVLVPDEFVTESGFENIYCCGYIVPKTYHDGVYCFVYSFDLNSEISFVSYSWNYASNQWNFLSTFEIDFSDGFDSYDVYFDDGMNLPEGVEWNDELRSYFVPSVKPVLSPNYSDTLFGSMFNEDNFLAELGKESLKDNPQGFAPYGSLIKFLDDTVFHMSDNSLALMGYGYVYYCGHVVLLDLIAMILLFIPRIIAMVLEFVTKGVDSR